MFQSDSSSHYTAWSSTTTLIKKDLVLKSNTLPAKYSLTEQGRDLAFKLIENDGPKESQSQKEPKKTKKASARMEYSSSSSDSDECTAVSKAFKSSSQSQSQNKMQIDPIVVNSDSESNDDIVVITKPLELNSQPMSISQSSTKSFNYNDILVSMPAGSYEILLVVDTCETSHA